MPLRDIYLFKKKAKAINFHFSGYRTGIRLYSDRLGRAQLVLIKKRPSKQCPESVTEACLRKAELHLKPLKKETLQIKTW